MALCLGFIFWLLFLSSDDVESKFFVELENDKGKMSLLIFDFSILVLHSFIYLLWFYVCFSVVGQIWKKMEEMS